MNLQQFIENLQQYYILDNRLDKILLFVAVLGFGLLFKRFFSKYLGRFVYVFFKRISNEVPAKDFLELLQKPFERLLTIVIIYFATKNLILPNFIVADKNIDIEIHRWINNIYEGAFIISLTWIVLRLLDFGLIVIKNNPEYSKEKMNGQLFPFFKEFFKILVMIFSFFFLLGAAFDLDVTSIIAGLGIGGLAVALAGKETLENLIASFTIFLDKPFIVGDLVQVGNIIGTVEKVGFRSTRIRTVEKSLLTIPNKQLVDQPLDNQHNRSVMRVKVNLMLDITTPNEKIMAFNESLKEALEATDFIEKNVNNWFGEISANGVEIQLLYFVKTNDFTEYGKMKEKGNFIIKGVLERLGIELAKSLSHMIIKTENQGVK